MMTVTYMQVSITNKLLSNGAYIRKCQNPWLLALEAFISKIESPLNT